MITIYQIPITDSQIAKANVDGFHAVPEVYARAKMMMGAPNWKPEYFDYYEPVYEVATDNLNQAFESTNLWEDTLVTRLANGSSSSKVGDIFAKENGDCFIVDSFGFSELGQLVKENA